MSRQAEPLNLALAGTLKDALKTPGMDQLRVMRARDAELFVREVRPPGFIGLDDLWHLDWCTKGTGVIKQADNDW